MLLWGVIWGAVLGLFWPGGPTELHLIAGAVLGGIAGLTLRSAVRNEIAGQQRLATAAPPQAVVVAAPVPARAPVARPEIDPEAPTIPSPLEPLAARTASEPAPAPARPETRSAPAQPNLLARLFESGWDWLFGGNTVVRMGVVVLFIGLAFLARYAVENAMLPPELRLAAIGAAGIALFVFGLRMRGRPGRRGYSLTLQGAGIAVLYLAVFAAFRLYQFLPAAAAFGALALICLFSTIIALALDALPLAFIGFAGAFAAPVLVSTGQGHHVTLFSYYLLLGVAIAVIAWLRAWRPLNLLGFFATFGVATAWGVLKYRPEHFASTEPFLIGFFLVYLLASLFYALRHGHAARKAVDATLVFGTPIVAFGLQAALVREFPYAMAFSSLVLAALYLALGSWVLRRRSGDATVNRWLAECFLALALGFLTLAVPLALDGRWTSAVWAVEGAGVYWMGRRQGRWLARAIGIALQPVAGLLYLDAASWSATSAWPVANPAFLGAAMLAGASLAIAWWARHPLVDEGGSAVAGDRAQPESGVSRILFWLGFFWCQATIGVEVFRNVPDLLGRPTPLFEGTQRHILQTLGWVVSAFALHFLALPRRRAPWLAAATPAWLVLPLMLHLALAGMTRTDHVFQGVGWFAWPLMLALHFRMLRRLDAGAPQPWWPWVHAGGVWLVVLLAGNLLVSAIGRAQLWQTAWATVILLTAASLVLMALVQSCRHALQAGSGRRWPLDRFTRAYAWIGGAPLALGLAAGALLVAVASRGQSKPLPYIPLLNPTDLSVALALAVCTLWLLRMRQSRLPLPAVMHGPVPPAVLAAITFVAINTVWLRVAHHWGGVPWDAQGLYASFLVQAGYSILWTLIALVLMIGAHRRAMRAPWMLGAGLLALTVLKLFVVDLSNRGGSERIVVFIAVGLLMLVVGWFAPLPPTQPARPRESATGLQGAAP